MILYEMREETKEGNGFLSDLLIEKKKWWSLTMPDNAKLVSSKEECERYNTIYAIAHNTEEMSFKKLLHVMYEKLNTSEVKTLCEKEPWIANKFDLYLQSPFNNDKFRKKWKTISKNGNSAEGMATAAYVNSLLH